MQSTIEFPAVNYASQADFIANSGSIPMSAYMVGQNRKSRIKGHRLLRIRNISSCQEY
jgi:hypothetical protein